jgi:hypothetical protein
MVDSAKTLFIALEIFKWILRQQNHFWYCLHLQLLLASILFSTESFITLFGALIIATYVILQFSAGVDYTYFSLFFYTAITLS